jgi:hypothetical protein
MGIRDTLEHAPRLWTISIYTNIVYTIRSQHCQGDQGDPGKRPIAKAMPLKITDLDGEWEIEVPIRSATLEALRLQFYRLRQPGSDPAQIYERIGERFSESVLGVLDIDLRPPTDAQVEFAVAIARELGVNLPGEALQYRGPMADFLDRFSSLFYSRKNKDSG